MFDNIYHVAVLYTIESIHTQEKKVLETFLFIQKKKLSI